MSEAGHSCDRPAFSHPGALLGGPVLTFGNMGDVTELQDLQAVADCIIETVFFNRLMLTC
jgi:hypothetical protein